MENYPILNYDRESGDLPQDMWAIPEEPPLRLYIQGSNKAFELFGRIPESALAIVGTREPQARSTHLVKTCVEQLKNSSLIIVSGFAKGVDTAAHEQALRAGLPTVAVVACGLDVNYPRENQELRERILEANGLIISEYPAGTEPRAENFHRRNRLIAGWSKATWVVEAPQKSGALNTAKWARDFHRFCLATPCFPGDRTLAGNQFLIDRHCAIPFWNIGSLDVAWLGLADRVRQRRGRYRPAKVGELASKVGELTAQNGGATVQQILDWAMSRSFTPQEFFTTLQQAIESGAVSDCNGVLVSHQESD